MGTYNKPEDNCGTTKRETGSKPVDENHDGGKAQQDDLTKPVVFGKANLMPAFSQ